MPVHIEEMTSDVTVMDGDLPFSETQLDKLADLLWKRMESRMREKKQAKEATHLGGSAQPSTHSGE